METLHAPPKSPVFDWDYEIPSSEAARMLGVTRQTIFNRQKQGDCPKPITAHFLYNELTEESARLQARINEILSDKANLTQLIERA